MRGSIREHGDSRIVEGRPHPEFKLRSNSGLSRKQGEAKNQSLRKQRRLLPCRALLRFHHGDRGHVEDAAGGD